MPRRVLSLANFLVAALVVLASLSVAVHAAASGKRVAVMVGPTQDRFIGGMSKAFQNEATALGFQATIFSTPYDPALQSQQIDDAIAQKYDLLVVQTASQDAVLPALTRAKAAHIPVVLLDAPLALGADHSLYVSYSGEDSRHLGEQAGEALGRALVADGRSKAKVAAVTGIMTEGIAPLRMEGFKSALAKYPGIQIVAIEDVSWIPPRAEQAASQIIARFSGKGGIDGFYGMNDSLAEAVVQAADSAGLKVGTQKGALFVVGGNCQTPGIKGVQNGTIVATTSLSPIWIGKTAADVAGQILDGKKVKKDNYEPTVIIDKANVAQYAAPCNY